MKLFREMTLAIVSYPLKTRLMSFTIINIIFQFTMNQKTESTSPKSDIIHFKKAERLATAFLFKRE